MDCPKCGASNYPGQRNCRSCLAPLSEHDEADLSTILRAGSLKELQRIMSTRDSIRYAIALDFEMARRILRRISHRSTEALYTLDSRIWKLEKRISTTLKKWADSDSRGTRVLSEILSWTAYLIAFLSVNAIITVLGGPILIIPEGNHEKANQSPEQDAGAGE